MDKGDTVSITKKFKEVLADLPKRFTFTETEKNAIEFAIELYDKELAQLNTDTNYKGYRRQT